MSYVIAEPWVDVLDRACVQECPVEAIYYEDDLPQRWQAFAGDNGTFFIQTLPRRDGPLGSPPGAAKLGRVVADITLVAGRPVPS